MPEQDKTAKLRAMGKWKFIILYGVCGWGLLSAAIFLGLVLWQHRSDLMTILSPAFLKQLLTVIIIFPCGGFLWGMFMWRSLDKKIGN